MTSSIWHITKDEAVAEHGMVVSREAHAARVGLDVLKRGGNAVDAAVSMALTPSVVEPASSGIGGGLMLVHQERIGGNVTIDYAMDALITTGPTTFTLDPTGGAGPYGWPKVAGDANAVGYRAVAVPGLLRGILAFHLRAEAMHRAFSDRYHYAADPKQVAVPWRGLLSPGYVRLLTDGIQTEQAAARVEAGDPWAFDDSRPNPAALVPRSCGVGGDGSTTHVSVVDWEGNAVALTQTHVANFGSGVVILSTGVVLNNAMAWFDPIPDRANSLASGKRGLNNLTPLIVTHGGSPLLTLGASGGRRIFQAVTSILLNVLDYGMGIWAPIAAPRIDCSGPHVMINTWVPTDTILLPSDEAVDLLHQESSS